MDKQAQKIIKDLKLELKQKDSLIENLSGCIADELHEKSRFQEKYDRADYKCDVLTQALNIIDKVVGAKK